MQMLACRTLDKKGCFPYLLSLRERLRTERERYAKRLSSSMDQMQAFYDAAFPRAKPALKYLNQFELNNLSEQAQTLLFLLYSLVMVSFPVEVWKQPHVPDAGAAYLDLVEEPLP